MRDPQMMARAQRAAVTLEQAWRRWRVVHGLAEESVSPVSSYVGYSTEEPWGRPRVVFGVGAHDAELLAELLERHECSVPVLEAQWPEPAGRVPAQGTPARQGPVPQSLTPQSLAPQPPAQPTGAAVAAAARSSAPVGHGAVDPGFGGQPEVRVAPVVGTARAGATLGGAFGDVPRQRMSEPPSRVGQPHTSAERAATQRAGAQRAAAESTTAQRVTAQRTAAQHASAQHASAQQAAAQQTSARQTAARQTAAQQAAAQGTAATGVTAPETALRGPATRRPATQDPVPLDAAGRGYVLPGSRNPDERRATSARPAMGRAEGSDSGFRPEQGPAARPGTNRDAAAGKPAAHWFNRHSPEPRTPTASDSAGRPGVPRTDMPSAPATSAARPARQTAASGPHMETAPTGAAPAVVAGPTVAGPTMAGPTVAGSAMAGPTAAVPDMGSVAFGGGSITAELAGWASGELPGQASAGLAAWESIGGVPAPGTRREGAPVIGAAATITTTNP
ncbi:MAG TPA: hypothetical protein VGS19_36440 [Streptosporangiaceae bacterium]|nr:hypothetical protein [Streptosporangiaceae bacterium]